MTPRRKAIENHEDTKDTKGCINVPAIAIAFVFFVSFVVHFFPFLCALAPLREAI